MQTNLQSSMKDYATYLPAMSSFYVKQLGKSSNDPNFINPTRIPAGFEKGINALDFLNDPNGYFYYPSILYSAGHAERNLSKCNDKEPLIHKRNRANTVVVGDSGGFQIATNVIKVDWATFATPAGDVFREGILRYLEHTSDWSMTLDIPAISAIEPYSLKTGLTKFQDTLDLSIINLHYFMKHRKPEATKFLNVLSGSNIENARIWYDNVKNFSSPSEVVKMGYPANHTLEGYAFAGVNMKNMSALLERLISLRDDGLLKGKDWIHFLGIGRLDWSCFLTSIKRQIVKHHNKNLNISFDAASPFVSVAYGLSYNYNYFTPKKLSYSMDRAIDDKQFKNTSYPMPWQSPIMDRLTTGDVCVMGPTCTNKNGKTGRTSWDTFSYLLYMAHNVFNHISAVQEINRLADIEYIRNPVSYKSWRRQSKSSSHNEVSLFVPSNILFFNDFVEKLFDPKNAKNSLNMISENKAFLDSISFGGTNTNTFSSMFEAENIIPSDDVLSDLNNEKLTDLENEND